MTGRLRVLVACVHYPPASKAGGPVRSVAGVVSSEAPGHEVAVVCSDRDLGDTAPMVRESPLRRDGATIHYENPARLLEIARRAVTASRPPLDILYLNSLFAPGFTLLPLLLWRTRRLRADMVLIAPRGELARSALGLKAGKKAAALPVIRALLRSRRVVWQATSDVEHDDILRFMPDATVIRHDNSWPAPDAHMPIKSAELTLIYAARIAPIKNPATAILALKGATGPIRLIMAGVEEDPSVLRDCHRAVSELESTVTVDFVGHLSPTEMAESMRGAHGLILPTSGENFGHAIAEGLSHGCFLLVPDTTPWSAAVRDGAGRLITPDPSPLNEDVIREISARGTDAAVRAGREALSIYTRLWQEQERGRRSLFETARVAAAERTGRR